MRKRRTRNRICLIFWDSLTFVIEQEGEVQGWQKDQKEEAQYKLEGDEGLAKFSKECG